MDPLRGVDGDIYRDITISAFEPGFSEGFGVAFILNVYGIFLGTEGITRNNHGWITDRNGMHSNGNNPCDMERAHHRDPIRSPMQSIVYRYRYIAVWVVKWGYFGLGLRP